MCAYVCLIQATVHDQGRPRNAELHNGHCVHKSLDLDVMSADERLGAGREGHCCRHRPPRHVHDAGEAQLCRALQRHQALPAAGTGMTWHSPVC